MVCFGELVRAGWTLSPTPRVPTQSGPGPLKEVLSPWPKDHCQPKPTRQGLSEAPARCLGTAAGERQRSGSVQMGAGGDGRDMSVSLEDSYKVANCLIVSQTAPSRACKDTPNPPEHAGSPILAGLRRWRWSRRLAGLRWSLTSGKNFLGSHRPLASVTSVPIGITFHSH